MVNRVENKYGNVTVVQNSEYQWGVVDSKNNIIVPFGKYGWIDGFDHGFARVRTHGKTTYTKNIVASFSFKKGTLITSQEELAEEVQQEFAEHSERFAKWGIIDENGIEVLPVEYDVVWNFLGRDRFSTKVVKDGVESEFQFREPDPKMAGFHRLRCYDYDDYDHDDYGTHYGEYEGTYAQDVAGFSDDVINDAFDGDPEAYWNID